MHFRCRTLFGVVLVVLAVSIWVLSPILPPQQVVVTDASESQQDDQVTVAAASQPEVASPSCPKLYSSVRCVDDGNDTFVGARDVYGFPIYNRTCVYSNIVYEPNANRFVYYRSPSDLLSKSLPPVSLAPRPYDLPIRHYKRNIIRSLIGRYYEWKPLVVDGPLPCSLPTKKRLLAYYLPIVAPWNYAHTLMCDLFGLFWAMFEHSIVTPDVQVVAVSAHYRRSFALPNRNVAFKVFSRLPALYDVALPHAIYSSLVVGTGTKSWSWVTNQYAAAGTSDLWEAFRSHIINVTGALERRESTEKTIRVSICHKKDKRGIANYEETMAFLQENFRTDIAFVLEGAVGRSPTEQVQMMLDADVFMCNEGTLATSFFLMRPGSVFVSLPLVYHSPHLHIRQMPHPSQWWKEPDMMRPDPRKNTGGNIDWFPPSIKWVKVFWYDVIPLNETRIQLPLVGLRNYMPDYNIALQQRRLVPLMATAFQWVLSRRQLTPHERLVDVPNYSVNADLCRQLLQLTPSLTTSFNTARCYYGMSWLCELYTNTVFRWRVFHEKWALSRTRCGSNRSSVEGMHIHDPRLQRDVRHYAFYSRQQLEEAYTKTDLGSFKADAGELDNIFAGA